MMLSKRDILLTLACSFYRRSQTIPEDSVLPFLAFAPSNDLAICMHQSLSTFKDGELIETLGDRSLDSLRSSWEEALVAHAVALTMADMIASSQWILAPPRGIKRY